MRRIHVNKINGPEITVAADRIIGLGIKHSKTWLMTEDGYTMYIDEPQNEVKDKLSAQGIEPAFISLTDSDGDPAHIVAETIVRVWDTGSVRSLALMGDQTLDVTNSLANIRSQIDNL